MKFSSQGFSFSLLRQGEEWIIILTEWKRKEDSDKLIINSSIYLSHSLCNYFVSTVFSRLETPFIKENIHEPLPSSSHCLPILEKEPLVLKAEVSGSRTWVGALQANEGHVLTNAGSGPHPRFTSSFLGCGSGVQMSKCVRVRGKKTNQYLFYRKSKNFLLVSSFLLSFYSPRAWKWGSNGWSDPNLLGIPDTRSH